MANLRASFGERGLSKILKSAIDPWKRSAPDSLDPMYNDVEDLNNPGYALYPAMGTLRNDMGAYGGGDSMQVRIDDQIEQEPNRFMSSQNYPNPFNASTTIKYSIPEPSEVVIEIYDILGRGVETIVQGEQSAGDHQLAWNAEDQSSGVYFYRIQAGEYSETKKMALLR